MVARAGHGSGGGSRSRRLSTWRRARPPAPLRAVNAAVGIPEFERGALGRSPAVAGADGDVGELHHERDEVMREGCAEERLSSIGGSAVAVSVEAWIERRWETGVVLMIYEGSWLMGRVLLVEPW